MNRNISMKCIIRSLNSKSPLCKVERTASENERVGAKRRRREKKMKIETSCCRIDSTRQKNVHECQSNWKLYNNNRWLADWRTEIINNNLFTLIVSVSIWRICHSILNMYDIVAHDNVTLWLTLRMIHNTDSDTNHTNTNADCPCACACDSIHEATAAPAAVVSNGTMIIIFFKLKQF